MANFLNPQLLVPSSSPLIQDVFQKLHSIGTDFLWAFSLYHQQLTINKELEDQKKSLKDQIFSLQASHEILRQYCSLAEQKISSLEASLLDDSDCGRDFEPEVPATVEEQIRMLEEQIVNLKGENHSMKEPLEKAGDVIIANAKKINEFQEISDARIHQTGDLGKDCAEAL